MAEDGADAWFKHGRRRKGAFVGRALSLHFISCATSLKFHPIVDGAISFGTRCVGCEVVTCKYVVRFTTGEGTRGVEGELDYADAFAALINT